MEAIFAASVASTAGLSAGVGGSAAGVVVGSVVLVHVKLNPPKGGLDFTIRSQSHELSSNELVSLSASLSMG